MRFMLTAVVIVTLWPGVLPAQAPLEFDVAAIKRNTTNTFASGPPPNPASGQVSMINVPVQMIVLRGYPLQSAPVQVIGLPDWAQSERYDVIAKGTPGGTPDEQQQMWRALLTARLKLQAHYETRERPGYNLVFARADQQLGPQLRPSTLDCTKPPGLLNLAGAPDPKNIEAMAMSRCSMLMMMGPSTQTAYTGGITIASLVRTMSGMAGRPIVDRTGLEGYYSVKLSFARETPLVLPGGAAAPPPTPTDEVPSLFTAVQEQLGLKLESATVQGQVLVIDHIERPTEN